MANKYARKKIPELKIDFKKISIGKVRDLYRRFGTTIPVGKVKYTMNFCEFVYFNGSPCEEVCDTVNKQVYITIQKKESVQDLQKRVFDIWLYAVMTEVCIESKLDMDGNLRKLVSAETAKNFCELFNFNLRVDYKPA